MKTLTNFREDNGYITTGAGPGVNIAVSLAKTDSNGNIQWTKIFDVGGAIDIGYSVQQTTDGGYIVGGIANVWANLGGQYGDVYLLKTYASGNMEWEKCLGH